MRTTHSVAATSTFCAGSRIPPLSALEFVAARDLALATRLFEVVYDHSKRTHHPFLDDVLANVELRCDGLLGPILELAHDKPRPTQARQRHDRLVHALELLARGDNAFRRNRLLYDGQLGEFRRRLDRNHVRVADVIGNQALDDLV